MATDAQIVKFVRELKGMTQKELAAKIGIDEMTVSRLERGAEHIKDATRARISAELGLQFDWATRSILPPADLPPDEYLAPKRAAKRKRAAPK